MRTLGSRWGWPVGGRANLALPDQE